jgi:hypothetical protein
MSENEIPENAEGAEENAEVEAHGSVLDLQGTEGVSKGGGNCVSLVSVVESAEAGA